MRKEIILSLLAVEIELGKKRMNRPLSGYLLQASDPVKTP